MAQWVKVHAAKQDDVNLIPENHIMKGRTDFFELSSNLCSMSGILKINNMHIILILSPEKSLPIKLFHIATLEDCVSQCNIYYEIYYELVRKIILFYGKVIWYLCLLLQTQIKCLPTYLLSLLIISLFNEI